MPRYRVVGAYDKVGESMSKGPRGSTCVPARLRCLFSTHARVCLRHGKHESHMRVCCLR